MHAESTMTADRERRARARRAALVLALVAFAVYAGFILMSVLHVR